MKKQTSTMLTVLLIGSLAIGAVLYFSWGDGGDLGIGENIDTEPPKSGSIDYTVRPSVENLDVSEANPLNTSSLVENANQFAFEMYSELAKDGKNAFLSPYSIYTCLGMVYEGARGETAAEMEEALNLPEDDGIRRPAFADLQKNLNTDRKVELKTANALWPQENYPFRESFLEAVRKYYLASIAPMDYKENSEGAVEQINSWAAEHTENKITKVLDSLSRSTRLVLTNAIYFKGDWMIPFDESKTEDETFYLSNGSTVQTSMMEFHKNIISENSFHYSETDGFKALKLFYEGEEMSMTFLLPKDQSKGTGWIKEQVDHDLFEEVENGLSKKMMGRIKIPKFEFRTEYTDEFMDALKNLGMEDAFNPSAADFTGMEKSELEDLYISDTIHKTYIKVDEVGTEAAAVTAVVMKPTSAPEPKPTFTANHPFMFLIKDEKTGSILFAGSVANPQE